MLNKINGIKNIKSKNENLNILKELGLERDENLYSDLILKIISTDQEGGISFINDIISNYSDIRFNNNDQLLVYREYYRIDLTIISTNKKFIIGIENKIDALEQDEQIKRYQRIFEEYYNDYEGIFLFLTPSGHNPTTANSLSKYKCHNLSYSKLLDSLQIIKDVECIETVVKTLIDSIKDNIIMNTHDHKEINHIWGSIYNRNILKKLILNKPNILIIQNDLEKKISDFLFERNDNISSVWTYSDKELHFEVESLNSNNLPIDFMFYDYIDKENTPCLRVVIYKDNYLKIPKTRIAKYKEKQQLAFEPIKNWSAWVSIFSGRIASPDFQVTIDHNYDDQLVDILFNAFRSEYVKIKDFIITA